MGKFERAVNNNEIRAYFKGEGDYFSPEEGNMGYHNEILNFIGMMWNVYTFSYNKIKGVTVY